MEHPDEMQRIWRAHADDTAEVTVHAAGPGLKPGSRQQQLAAWARASPELLSHLQQLVRQLIGAC